MKLRLFLFLYLVVQLVANANQLVRYNISEKYPDPKQAYYIDLLRLALEETKPEYGSYFLQPVPIEMSQGQTTTMVELDHGIDVTWRMTTADLEQRMSAIYIPLLKGLMGNRIFIIRKDDQKRFAPELSLKGLSKMVAGQGHDWPDSDILIYNNVRLVKGEAHSLLDMLSKARFDYFPRALHEPWTEISDKANFTVEENLMFQYPAPMYFFVNKKNTLLRDRIYNGLAKAIENGNFDKLFKQHPVTKNILNRANVDERKVFTLTNPLLSPETKAIIEDKRLWLSKVSEESSE